MPDNSMHEIQPNKEVSRAETSRAPHSVDEGIRILQDRLGLITKATEYNPTWVPGNSWRPTLLIIDTDSARMPWYGGGGTEFAEKDRLEASLLGMLGANGFDLNHPVATSSADWLRNVDRMEPSHVWGDEGKLVPNPKSGTATHKQKRVDALTLAFKGPEIPFVHKGTMERKTLSVTRTDYTGDVNQRVWRIYSRFPAELSQPIPPVPPTLGRGWTMA